MGSCNVILARDQLNELAMNMTTLLHTEVANRFAALPEVERIDKTLALVRITAEVVRDLMRDCPEAVDDFLRHFVPQRAN